MPRDKSHVVASLTRKGFKSREGDHTFLIYHTLEGKKTPVRTKTSHTPKMKDIPDALLGQMARQCRLSKQQFLELVDCPLDRVTYEECLRFQKAI